MDTLYTVGYRGAFIHASRVERMTHVKVEVFRIQLPDGRQLPARTFLGAKRLITRNLRSL